ncbi:dethiobiotin synthase [Actinopolymorpha pittospori]
MSVLLVTGTGTEVGKTVVTAAVAALAHACGQRVAVLKAAQTGVGPGEPGDVEEVARLAGPVSCHELARYPDPLAPATAARRSGRAALRPGQVAAEATRLAADHDLVLVEGAGGLLVRYDDEGGTLADVAVALRHPVADGLDVLDVAVLVVTTAGLGTLNTTALTAESLRSRGLPLRGLVIGSWPGDPDLATRCNLADLPVVADAPILGAIPENSSAHEPRHFLAVARASLARQLGGTWDAGEFTARHLGADAAAGLAR